MEVSPRCRRGCSSGFCWRSPWQEPPEKQSRDERVFMETSEVHREKPPVVELMRDQTQERSFILFFPHHEKLALLPHTRLCREVSAAQVFCPPAAVSP